MSRPFLFLAVLVVSVLLLPQSGWAGQCRQRTPPVYQGVDENDVVLWGQCPASLRVTRTFPVLGGSSCPAKCPPKSKLVAPGQVYRIGDGPAEGPCWTQPPLSTLEAVGCCAVCQTCEVCEE